MWFTDFSETGNWMPSTHDAFWVTFFENRLVTATAVRNDVPFVSYADEQPFVSYENRVGLELGSPSYGQPSSRNNHRPERMRADVCPAFNRIFRCPPDARLDKARADFEAQVKADAHELRRLTQRSGWLPKWIWDWLNKAR